MWFTNSRRTAAEPPNVTADYIRRLLDGSEIGNSLLMLHQGCPRWTGACQWDDMIAGDMLHRLRVISQGQIEWLELELRLPCFAGSQ